MIRTNPIRPDFYFDHIPIARVHGHTISSGPEIERRFLIRSLPENLEQYKQEDMKQGYVLEKDDKSDYRLRQVGDTYILTVKEATNDPLVRQETELEISKDNFEQLWKSTKKHRIKKTRVYIPTNEKCKTGFIELDLFKKKLKGFVIAEVEFDSIEQANKFTPPDWFGKEVTNDKRYRSKSLALKGLPE